MPSILFVCTANRFRSPLAAALFQKNLEQAGILASWSVASAGTWASAGEPAIPGVILAARRYQLDLSKHRSRRVDEALLTRADLTLVMQSGHKEALLSEFPTLQDHIYLLSDVVEQRTYDIPDTFRSERELAEVLSELDTLLRQGLESICILATYLNNSRQRPAR